VSFAAPRRLPWLLGLSALILLADRLSKVWVDKHVPFGGAIPIIPRVLRITHWTNEGAAFSLFADSASPNTVRWTLIAFSVFAALVVLVAMVRLGSRFTLTTVALALILAGALGNVHDRIVYGSVVDFIEVHIFTYHWPDFNIADSSIVIGACLLMVDSLLPKKGEQGPASADEKIAARVE
jgi:signal peptidase II